MPPSSHFIYIPVILMLGLALGFVLGARATRDALAQEQKREAERQARKAAREARHAAQAAVTGSATATAEPDSAAAKPDSGSSPAKS
jgi:hypothetical protein